MTTKKKPAPLRDQIIAFLQIRTATGSPFFFGEPFA